MRLSVESEKENRIDDDEIMKDVYQFYNKLDIKSPGFYAYIHDRTLWRDDNVYFNLFHYDHEHTEGKKRYYHKDAGQTERLLSSIRIEYNRLSAKDKRNYEKKGITMLSKEKKENDSTFIKVSECEWYQEGRFNLMKSYQCNQVIPHICLVCRIGMKSKEEFQEHLKTHMKMKLYGCHKCFELFLKKQFLDAHEKKGCKEKLGYQNYRNISHFWACLDCGYSCAYDYDNDNEVQMEKLKKLTLFHNCERMELVELITNNKEPKKTGKFPTWRGRYYKITLKERAKQANHSCRHTQCSKTFEKWSEFERHMGDHLMEGGMGILFCDFLNTLNRQTEQLFNPFVPKLLVESDEEDTEKKLRKIKPDGLSDICNTKPYKMGPIEVDLNPTEAYTFLDRGAYLPFKVKITPDAAMPGVTKTAARILLCTKCDHILIGLKEALGHITACFNNQNLDWRDLINGNKYVFTLLPFNHWPSQKIKCPKYMCNLTCCSVQGCIVHLARYHGIQAYPDSSKLRELRKSHRTEWVKTRQSFLTMKINQICFLNKDSRLPGDSATNKYDENLSDKDLMELEDGIPPDSEEVPLDTLSGDDLDCDPQNFLPLSVSSEERREPLKLIIKRGSTIKETSEETIEPKRKCRKRRDQRSPEPISLKPGSLPTVPELDFQDLLDFDKICFHCGLEFESADLMTRHLKHHDLHKKGEPDILEIYCYWCFPFKKFGRFDEFLHHMLGHSKKRSNGMNECQSCHVQFSLRKFVQHFLRGCSVAIGNCGICGIKIDSDRRHNKELELYHAKHFHRFICYCDMKFSYYPDFLEHNCVKLVMKLKQVDLTDESLIGANIHKDALAEFLKEKRTNDKNAVALFDSTKKLPSTSMLPISSTLTIQSQQVPSSPTLTTIPLSPLCCDRPPYPPPPFTFISAEAGSSKNIQTEKCFSPIKQPPVKIRKKSQDSKPNLSTSQSSTASSVSSITSPLLMAKTYIDESVKKDDDEEIVVIQEVLTSMCKTEPDSVDDEVTFIEENRDTKVAPLPPQPSTNIVTSITSVKEDADLCEVYFGEKIPGPKKVKEKKIQCPQCTARFHTNKGLHSHLDNQHNTWNTAKDISQLDPPAQNIFGVSYKDVGYLCPHCVFIFEDRNHHIFHMDKHLELGTKLFSCDYCSAIFVNGSIQQEHQGFPKGHALERNGEGSAIEYWCTHCPTPIVFLREAGYFLHIMEAHQVPIFYYCKNCLMGSCDFKIICDHIENQPCWADEWRRLGVSTKTMGFVVAQDLHLQPRNEKEMIVKNKDLTLFVQPNYCSKRTMLRTMQRSTSCSVPDDKEKCFALSAFWGYEAYLRKTHNLYDYNQYTLDLSCYPTHNFANEAYNIFNWMMSQRNGTSPPVLQKSRTKPKIFLTQFNVLCHPNEQISIGVESVTKYMQDEINRLCQSIQQEKRKEQPNQNLIHTLNNKLREKEDNLEDTLSFEQVSPDYRELAECVVCRHHYPSELLITVVNLNHTGCYDILLATMPQRVNEHDKLDLYSRLAQQPEPQICFLHVIPQQVILIDGKFTIDGDKDKQSINYMWPDYAHPALNKIAYLDALLQICNNFEAGRCNPEDCLATIRHANQCNNQGCNHIELSTIHLAQLHRYHSDLPTTPDSGIDYLCYACFKTFSSEDMIIAHMIQCHIKKPSFDFHLQCPVAGCTKIIFKPPDMREHLVKEHKFDNKARTPGCRLVFATANARDRHDEIHSRMDQGADRCCHFCGMCPTFTRHSGSGRNKLSINHLYRHAFQVHYMCKLCMTMKKTRTDLIRHALTEHDIHSGKCPPCGDHQVENIGDHIAKNHEMDIFSFHAKSRLPNGDIAIQTPEEFKEFLGLNDN